MSRYGVLIVMPLLVALAMTVRGAPESGAAGAAWADAGGAGPVRADATSPQPGASRPQAIGGAPVGIVSQGRGQKAPRLDQVKPVQRPVGRASFEIVGQGAGQPGTDRKPAGVGRGRQQPRILGEGTIRQGMGWKSATVQSKQHKVAPPPAVRPGRR